MVFFIKLILRNILRHRLRSGLTATGIVVAIVAFGMLRTLVDAWYAGAEATSATRLVTRNAISLVFPPAYQLREQDPPSWQRHGYLLRQLVRRRLYQREKLFPAV
jgi:hypothetical protein